MVGSRDTVSVDIALVAYIALTCHSVKALVGSAHPASSQDPEVSVVAVALSVFQVSVDSTILVAAALSVDHSVARSADTALSFLVIKSVKGTGMDDPALSIIDWHSVFTNTFTVLVG